VFLSLWFLFLPLFWVMGVTDVGPIAGVLGPIGAAALLSHLESRRENVRPAVTYACLALTLAGFAMLGRILGPIVLVPMLAATYAVTVQTHPHRMPRRVAMVACCLTIALPLLLEYLGVLERTFWVEGARLVIRTPAPLREGPTVLFFAVAGVGATLSPCLFVSRIRDELSQAERRVQLHMWHVEQLMPTRVSDMPALRGAISAQLRRSTRRKGA
jgi:hypothetical protein